MGGDEEVFFSFSFSPPSSFSSCIGCSLDIRNAVIRVAPVGLVIYSFRFYPFHFFPCCRFGSQSNRNGRKELDEKERRQRRIEL